MRIFAIFFMALVSTITFGCSNHSTFSSHMAGAPSQVARPLDSGSIHYLHSVLNPDTGKLHLIIATEYAVALQGYMAQYGYVLVEAQPNGNGETILVFQK